MRGPKPRVCIMSCLRLIDAHSSLASLLFLAEARAALQAEKQSEEDRLKNERKRAREAAQVANRLKKAEKSKEMKKRAAAAEAKRAAVAEQKAFDRACYRCNGCDRHSRGHTSWQRCAECPPNTCSFCVCNQPTCRRLLDDHYVDLRKAIKAAGMAAMAAKARTRRQPQISITETERAEAPPRSKRLRQRR
mmetsp:Transcript_1065/g.3275  ORF Transcript_1065/g.3275 Transcript_1065/m.3275 type:complete len:191 (-) Transcript_1065:134-706(-)